MKNIMYKPITGVKNKLGFRSDLLVSYFWAFIAAWTLIVIVFLLFGIYEIRHVQKDMAKREARASFHKDHSTRLWSTTHGGVYVPVTEQTPPNPFLSHIKERDIKTASGKRLTLMNPAYMLRQTMDKYEDLYGIRGHITSLDYFRPETSPDEWEKGALKEFQQGIKEVSEFTNFNGVEYYRYMAPMLTTEGCLKCHGHQGYKVGDIRGGISVSVPMAPYLANQNKQSLMWGFSLLLLWIMGCVGLSASAGSLKHKIREREHAESQLQKAHDLLEQKVSERTDDLTYINKRLSKEIQEHKETAKTLIKAKKEAEIANSAKSIFLANMSHEIRTPMNGIVGMTDLTLETDLTGKQLKYLRNIKKSTDYLMVVINDILDFSRIESKKIVIEKARFNIKELIELCLLPFVEMGHKRNIKVCHSIDNDIPDYLMGDSHRLNQVVINLIGNAVKFTDKGEVKLTITMKSKNEGNVFLKFAVQDTGIGIPLDKQKMIFDPFSQSDVSFSRSYGGTGLGLSITKQLVELMKGEIWLKSKPGSGSTFYFTSVFSIPEAEPSEKTSLQGKILEVTPEGTEQNSLNILLAEDNEINQELAIAYLEPKGHSVIIATTGIEALELFKKEKFDCVLMDVQMPEMDGMEATIQIREFEKSTGSHTPVIAMTAHALKSEQERFIKAGMDDYISKPFKADDLLKKIEILYKKDQ